ncbi:MAG TPA: hypothetical protein VIK99_04865 [Thermaerobacter sp.]
MLGGEDRYMVPAHISRPVVPERHWWHRLLAALWARSYRRKEGIA